MKLRVILMSLVGLLVVVGAAAIGLRTRNQSSEADQVTRCVDESTLRGFTAIDAWWQEGSRHVTWTGPANLDPVASMAGGYFITRLDIPGPRYTAIASGRNADCVVYIERLQPGMRPNSDKVDSAVLEAVSSGEEQVLEISIGRRR